MNQPQANPNNVGLGAELAAALELEQSQQQPQQQQQQQPQQPAAAPDVDFLRAVDDFEAEERERQGRHAPPPPNGGDPQDVLSDEGFNFLDDTETKLEQLQQQQQAPEQSPLDQQFNTTGQMVDHISPGAEVLVQAANSVGSQLQLIEEALGRQQQYLQSQEMAELEQDDPGEAALLRLKLSERRQELMGAYQQLQPQARQVQQAFANEARRRFMAVMQEQIPEWTNGQVAQREIGQMRAYAKKHLKYSDAYLAAMWDPAAIKNLRDNWIKHQHEHGTPKQQQRAGKVIRARKKQDFNSAYDAKVRYLEKKKRGRVSVNDKYSALSRTLLDMGYKL